MKHLHTKENGVERAPLSADERNSRLRAASGSRRPGIVPWRDEAAVRLRVPVFTVRNRAVLAAGGSGEVFVDAAKRYQSRTVPLTGVVATIAESRADGRGPRERLFRTLGGSAP